MSAPSAPETGRARLDAVLANLRREQGGRLAAAAMAAAVVAAGSVLLLGLSGWFIAAAALAGAAGPAVAQTFNYLTPSALIRLLAILRTGSRYIERLVGHQAALQALARLRPTLFESLAAAPPERALALSGGEASARLIQDVDAVQTLFVRLSAPWAAGTGAAVAVLLAMLAAPVAGLVLAVAMGLCVLGALAVARLLAEPAGREIQTRAGRLKATFVALQAATPELRAYGLGAWAAGETAASGRALDEAGVDAARAGGRIMAWQAAMAGAAVAAVLAAAATAGASVPMAALAALAAVTGIEAAGALAQAFRQNGQAVAALARLGEVMEPAAPGRDQAPQGAGIELAGLRLSLSPPDRLAVLGASGGGKTTLVERLLALRDGPAGELSVGGVDVAQAARGAVRARFAYAAQDVRLLDGSVRENLRLAAPQAGDDDLWAALADAALEDRVRAAPEGLDTPVGENGARLSGGERRRLGLARAYLRGAPWLVLDEPTEGLDAATEGRVLERLERRLARTGQGLILISHRPAPVGLCSIHATAGGLGPDGRVALTLSPPLRR